MKPESVLEVSCPTCGELLSYAADETVATLTCPECKSRFSRPVPLGGEPLRKESAPARLLALSPQHLAAASVLVITLVGAVVFLVWRGGVRADLANQARIVQLVNSAIEEARIDATKQLFEKGELSLQSAQSMIASSGQVDTLLTNRLEAAIRDLRAAQDVFLERKRIADENEKAAREAKERADSIRNAEARVADERRLARAAEEAERLRQTREAERNRVSGITWAEYKADCGTEAQRSNAVRSEGTFDREYKGKLIEWSGIVDSVDTKLLSNDYRVGVKMPATESITADIGLTVPQSYSSLIAQLRKGDEIRFRGFIKSQGGAFTTHDIDVQTISRK